MESTLALQQIDFQSRVGFYLGFGRGATYFNPTWTSDQKYDIDDCVGSGQRRFYYAPIPDGGIYQWSFLRPVVTLTLPKSVNTVPFPDDFNGVEGTVTVAASGSAATSNWYPVPMYNEGMVRARYAAFPSASGRPEMFAEQVLKGTTPVRGQRYQLYVWPLPDQAYTITFAYRVLPDAINPSNPYPYGGAQHAETFLESCLAVAEERLDDMTGVHAAAFQRMLVASIRQDQQRKPQLIGYNGDRSDAIARRDGYQTFTNVTYKGNQL